MRVLMSTGGVSPFWCVERVQLLPLMSSPLACATVMNWEEARMTPGRTSGVARGRGGTPTGTGRGSLGATRAVPPQREAQTLNTGVR